jgi:Carboxypeptidase regulatory-like domain
VRLVKITGVAVGSDGKPMAGSMVMLMPAMKDALQFMPGGTTRTNKDGQFTLNGVTPGEYSLQVQSMGAMFQAAGNAMAFAFSTSDSGPPGAAPPPQEREFAIATVTVAGEDISGLVVVGTRGAKASGTIGYEGGVKPEGTAGIRVTAPSADIDNNPMPTFGGANVKDTGAFEVDSLIGTRVFRVMNLPKGWVLKRVRLNGEDVTDKGLEFKPGEDVTGIDIELTNKTTSVSGGVTDGKSQPLKDYTLVIFAEDQAKWTLPLNRWTQSARPDQEGRFKLNNLPPGDYYAIAVDYVAQGEWSDPDWLARASKKATKFTLDDGGTKTLDLKLSSGS